MINATRNQLLSLGGKLKDAGYLDIEIVEPYATPGSYAITAVGPYGPARFTEIPEIDAAVKVVRQCEAEWGSCEEDYAHECGRPVDTVHVHRCRHCGEEPVARRINVNVSARTTDRGIRYTADQLGDEPGSLGHGDRVEVRQALTAAGIPAPTAAQILGEARAHRDRRTVTAFVTEDGAVTFA